MSANREKLIKLFSCVLTGLTIDDMVSDLEIDETMSAPIQKFSESLIEATSKHEGMETVNDLVNALLMEINVRCI